MVKQVVDACEVAIINFWQLDVMECSGTSFDANDLIYTGVAIRHGYDLLSE